jgi:hypothetical protein
MENARGTKWRARKRSKVVGIGWRERGESWGSKRLNWMKSIKEGKYQGRGRGTRDNILRFSVDDSTWDIVLYITDTLDHLHCIIKFYLVIINLFLEMYGVYKSK